MTEALALLLEAHGRWLRHHGPHRGRSADGAERAYHFAALCALWRAWDGCHA